MSAAVQQLLNAFERLSEDERRDALIELLMRADQLEYPPLDNETIDRIADEAFLEYELREAADGKG